MYLSIYPEISFTNLFKSNRHRENVKQYFDKNIYFYDSGRSALYDTLLDIGLKPGDKFLLPDYICDSILLPFKKLGIIPVFYNIDKNLHTSIDIQVGQCVGILIIHYFGLIQSNPKLIAIIKQYSLLVIEDFAHAIPSNNIISSYSHYAFFSLQKCFSLPDGGLLIANKPLSNSNAKPMKNLLMVKNLSKKVLYALDAISPLSLRGKLLNNQTIYSKVYKQSVLTLDGIYKMSRFSLWYNKKISYEEEHNRRRINYNYLYKQIKQKKINWIKELFPLTDRSSPLFFPILVSTRSAAQKVMFDMYKKNIGFGIFWPDPITYPIKHIYYGRILAIPIHKTEMLNKIVDYMENLGIN